MTGISEDRRREIAREYWRLKRQHGELAAITYLGGEYTLSVEEIRKIAEEFPGE